MNRLLAGLVAAFAFAAPLTASADTITLSAPLNGASLHEGGVDMNVYYTAAADRGFEVVATYAPVAAPAEAARLRMVLEDGDSVRFALPGHDEAIYAFQRNGAAVAVSVQPVPTAAAAPQS